MFLLNTNLFKLKRLKYYSLANNRVLNSTKFLKEISLVTKLFILKINYLVIFS